MDPKTNSKRSSTSSNSSADADYTSTQGAEFPTTVLEQTLTRAEAFYTVNSEREDDFGRRAHYPENFNSCFDILEHITNAFGARLYQNAFAWWFFPPNALNWSTSLKVQKWTRTQVSSESLGRVLSGFDVRSKSDPRVGHVQTRPRNQPRLGRRVDQLVPPPRQTVYTHAPQSGPTKRLWQPASSTLTTLRRVAPRLSIPTWSCPRVKRFTSRDSTTRGTS